MIEFDGFGEFDNFYFEIIKPFLIPMQVDGINGYGMEIPFKMNEIGKMQVVDFIVKYTEKNNKFKKIISFFQNIDYDKCFYVFDSEVPQEFCETCKESINYYNLKYDHDFVALKMQSYLEFNELSQKIIDEIQEEYELMFHSYWKKTFLGEKDKNKRTCRYCNKSMNDGVTYVNEAHAIPALLGNSTLFQNEECDECNLYFGKTIEIDLNNYSRLLRVFAGTKGRNGIPKLNNKGKTVFFSNSPNVYSGPVIISDFENHNEKKVEIEDDTEYIPANVYRILCKMFISVVNSDAVEMFQDTVKWIRYDECILEELPLIAFCILPNRRVERPEIVTYIRKNAIKKAPFAFMEFRFGNFVYIVQIPTKSNANELFYDACKFESFLKSFKHFENANFQYKDFSSKNKKTFIINIELQNHEG